VLPSAIVDLASFLGVDSSDIPKNQSIEHPAMDRTILIGVINRRRKPIIVSVGYAQQTSIGIVVQK
jgi:hypothetical protein